jgi:hypothetical protein
MRAEVLAGELGLNLDGINQGNYVKAAVQTARLFNADKFSDLNHGIARKQDANKVRKVEKVAREEAEKLGFNDEMYNYGKFKEMATQLLQESRSQEGKKVFMKKYLIRVIRQIG